MKIRIAIFVSGNGTNCENLIRHFADHPSIETVLVVCNRADAPVLQRIAPYHVPALVTDRVQLAQPQFVTMLQEQYHIHFIVLAGFLPITAAWSISTLPCSPSLAARACMGTMYTRR